MLGNSPGKPYQARSDSIQNEEGAKNKLRSRQPRPENLKKNKRSKKPTGQHQPKSENPKDERGAYDYYYYYYGNDYGSDAGN